MVFSGFIRKQGFTFITKQSHFQIVFGDTGRKRDVCTIWLGGTNIDGILKQGFPFGLENDFCLPARGCGIHPNLDKTVFRYFQIQGTVAVGILKTLQFTHGEPDHFNGFPLIGLKPAIVGLIVRIGSGHEFDIMAVVISEAGIRSVAGGIVTPSPEFHSRTGMVISDPDSAGLFTVIVSAKVIFFWIPGEERRRHTDIFPPADIHTRVVKTVVTTVRDRPCGHLPLGMLGDVLD
ncbi:hypothetical protein ES708_28785 [subsurface metagenome]